ncbi:hypothetical protein A3F29_00450 [Candidatus Roizmanbacteria bacterium RIFCSPHIGHO2_12_FULL_33_9]|uniref:Glycosyl transferase family 1 domain-containing protein n=1 Tax=Candidatus Roizmanbacteria bacterium RIFCSPHIGHO2_12_FULL_33_9 TaxID=1802045 RepID=A0A1F7HGU4_9BACT|nr:MAG: hypothetical protein A3F29_00450 [Candidatus Roizmanbacteria bacterium RIFCSPHIGHO2_12_FULL_33_9]
MKIGIYVSPVENPSLLSHRVRGTGFYIENLKRSLLKYDKGNEYVFFTQHRDGAGFTRGQNLPKNLDLVHYPYFEPFFLTLPIFSKSKYVVTVHDLIPLVFPEKFPPGIKGSIKWNIQKLSLKRAERIITDSNSSKNDIAEHIGISEDKIEVIYLAAGEEFRKLKIKNLKLKIKYGLPDRFLLYIGDVTWNKNLPNLITAVEDLNAALVMVGKALVSEDFDKNNPWNQDLVKVHKIVKNSKNILLLGFIENKDLVDLYNLATAFVMPSFHEGFGLPILEAMSCGCPVITSRGGSIPEVAGEAAFYVDPYDINDIKKGIKEVLSDEKFRKKMSEKGLMQSKKFSWKRATEETVKVYEKVMGKG